MTPSPNKLHPLLIVAATSVTVASLAAVASFTGLLPGHAAPPAAVTAPAPLAAAPTPTPTPTPTPVPTPAPEIPSPPPTAQGKGLTPPPPPVRKALPERHSSAPRTSGEMQRTSERPPAGNEAGIDVIPAPVARTPVTPPICRECGTVDSVREVKTPAEGSGLGAIAGGVLGGLLGNQMGKGHGRDATTVVGVLGGAYAGHQVEKNVRGGQQVQVTVQFDDGSFRTFTQNDSGRWRQGDRVRLDNGSLRPL